MRTWDSFQENVVFHLKCWHLKLQSKTFERLSAGCTSLPMELFWFLPDGVALEQRRVYRCNKGVAIRRGTTRDAFCVRHMMAWNILFRRSTHAPHHGNCSNQLEPMMAEHGQACTSVLTSSGNLVTVCRRVVVTTVSMFIIVVPIHFDSTHPFPFVSRTP